MYSVQTASLDAGQLDNETAAQFIIQYVTASYLPGQPRARRLVVIAEKTPDGSTLRQCAWVAARKEVYETKDSDLYKRIMKIKADPDNDSVWIERVERENRVLKSQFEAAYNRAKTNTSKEVSRYFFWFLGILFNVLNFFKIRILFNVY